MPQKWLHQSNTAMINMLSSYVTIDRYYNDAMISAFIEIADWQQAPTTQLQKQH